MKKLNTFTLVVFLSVMIFCCISIAQSQGSKMKRYGIKKACIEYTISGGMQNGAEVLYFDDWGSREAKYTKTKLQVAGISQETNTVTFLEGTWTYTVDLDKKTGTKMENPFLKALKGQDLQDLGKEMMIKMGGKKVGSGKILGKPCEIWEIKSMGTKTWVWSWITLKTETNMMGMKMTTTATKITDSFGKEKLVRPTNIKYQEMGDMMKLFKGMKKD